MKKTILLLFLFNTLAFAQRLTLEQIEQKLKKSQPDTLHVDLLNHYSERLLASNTSKADETIQKTLAFAQKIKYKRGIGYALINLGILQANYGASESMGSIGQAIEIFEETKNKQGVVRCLTLFGNFHRNNGDYPKALEYFFNALLISEIEGLLSEKKLILVRISHIYGLLGDTQKLQSYQDAAMVSTEAEQTMSLTDEIFMCDLLGENSTFLKRYEESIKYYQKAQSLSKYGGFEIIFYTDELNIANSLNLLGQPEKAEELAENALKKMVLFEENAEFIWGYLVLCRIYLAQNKFDKALYYGKLAYNNAKSLEIKEFQKNGSELLYQIYESRNETKLANFYKNEFTIVSDSLSGQRTRQLIEANQINFELETQKNQIVLLRKEGELNQISLKNQQNLLYFSLASALLFLGLVFVLFRNNRIQKKYFQKLNIQKQEIELQKNKLEIMLSELKTTQNQLIQSEKMASLGELTAGIAHEIQNPLNFVNNFSEMSVELIEELKSPPISSKNRSEWGIEKEELLTDISQNLEKINFHGKRASSIVTSMLEHSRASTGVRELTDVNKLADEYLRLSFHGLRAKDKNGSTDQFNSDFSTDFEENLPKIEVIPQDIGRVLLNLINNAFYAVKTVEKPLVIVETKQANNQLIIKVSDNGTGMSEATKAKIFQPFFTTKPTGQGTGLGLSLAYDIITKGHGGTIECQSIEGKGTTFVVKFPIK